MLARRHGFQLQRNISFIFHIQSLGISSYPVYHSVYETFYTVKMFIDYNFWRHQSVARVMLEFSRDLADSVILPFGVLDYANKLKSSIDNIEDEYGAKMAAQDITFGEYLVI